MQKIPLVALKPVVFAIASALAGSSAAQPVSPPATTAAPAAQTTDNASPPVVIVTSNAAERDAGIYSTASKTIMSRDEVQRYGDSNVLDVLKRAPGVVVVNRTVTMRGLGNGYTQVLVNGERPPPGFSLANLLPAEVERIEIMRSASAEFSTAAMAGTVNVVLRRVVTNAQRDLRIMYAPFPESRLLQPSVQLADRTGGFSYFVSAQVIAVEADNESWSQAQTPGSQREAGYDRLNKSETNVRSTVASISSRWNWKLDSNGQLNIQQYVQFVDREMRSQGRVLRNDGAAPPYTSSLTDQVQDNWTGRVDVNWATRLAGGRLNVTAGVTRDMTDEDDALRTEGGAGHAHWWTGCAARQR